MKGTVYNRNIAFTSTAVVASKNAYAATVRLDAIQALDEILNKIDADLDASTFGFTLRITAEIVDNSED